MSDQGLYPVPDDLGLGATVRGFVDGQRLFDRYVLQHILGRGGMGVVWLAIDEKLERNVALKFLPELIKLDRGALDDLKRETRRSLELTHPHIVRIYDFVDDATAAAISMEYVDGHTLSAWRVEQPSRVFEVDQIREWTGQLIEALDYAHRKAKLVHRDLKPTNLMINGAGDLKVADFGIARSISDSVSRVTLRAGTSGTLAYMSPQQALGADASVQDDIYAFGATLYELLTSKPPFYSGDVLAQLREVTPPRMAQRRGALGIDGAEIPDDWEATIAACLAKEPSQRPQSIAEVGERLGLRVAPMSKTAPQAKPAPKVEIPPPPPGPPPPKKKASGSGALKWIGIIFLILVLLGVGAITLLIALGQQVHSVFTTISSQLAQAPEAQVSVSPTPAPTPVVTPPTTVVTPPAPVPVVTPPPPAPVVTPPAPAPVVTPPPQPAVVGPVAGQEWYNSLGMKFVPAGTDGVLFCTWDVRVQDWRAFVQATGSQQPGGIFVMKVITNANGSRSLSWSLDPNASWENPGFEQGPTHPVVGVSWNDAEAFCQWLTKKEQAEGKLASNQKYRLPTDAEWSAAVGDGKYPWGESWPPPDDAGNYADQAFLASLPGTGWSCLPENDGYARTSPVGSFRPNAYGLYDMGGNVGQWCEDWYQASMNSDEIRQKVPALNNDGGGSAFKVLRGASWSNFDPLILLSSYRYGDVPGSRYDSYGFRVVVVVSP